MKKLGTKQHPIRCRVQNEDQATIIAKICEENGWKFICGIEPNKEPDISELEYMLNPDDFGGVPPKAKLSNMLTVVKTEPIISRNELCPCGSGKKYKKCCLGKN